MAEVESKNQRVSKTKSSFVKKNTKVDLTPMVDLGFLLITFFVFTTTMSTPTVMNLNMPYDKVAPNDPVCRSCVLTILLAKNNRIKYYEGMPAGNALVKETIFGRDGIRNIILQKRKAVNKITGSADSFVMIIKPSDESTFQNFVDIVDEVSINNVKHYYTSEIGENDRKELFKGPE